MQSSQIQHVKLASLPWESTVSDFQILKLQVATRFARHLCWCWESKLLSSCLQGKYLVPKTAFQLSYLIYHQSKMGTNIIILFMTVLTKSLLCYLSLLPVLLLSLIYILHLLSLFFSFLVFEQLSRKERKHPSAPPDR